MLQYFLKRLALFIPTLIAVTFIAFGLSKATPGDPVECHLPLSEMSETSSANMLSLEKEYRRTARSLNLDLPNFYLSFTAAAYPDTLYRILERDKRHALNKLIAQYGNWPLIQDYYQALRQFDLKLADLPDSLHDDAYINAKRATKQLFIQYNPANRENLIGEINNALVISKPLATAAGPQAQALLTSHQTMIQQQNQAALWQPTFHWHGFNNQYHRWVTNFFTGNFGKSCRDGRPVFSKIMEAVYWTVMLNLLSFAVSFILAIPIGVAAARRPDSWLDRLTTLGLFMLYAMPVFWIATLAVIFLTSPEYHLHLFPSIGLGRVPYGAGFWEVLQIRISHLILPVICLSYNNLAFISRQVRGRMIEVLNSDYVRTAKAKGLSPNKVVWRHAFRNALFPLITIFATLLPATIAGSLVIELIFNIPGMGLLIIQSIGEQDWNVVFAILVLAAVLTMLGNLLADMLYAWADPRVTFTTGNN